MLIGHRRIRDRLHTAFDDNRLAHALLFIGAPGIGKSAVARELARRVVCREASPPCDQCDRCVQVGAGSHPDVRFVSVPRGKKEIGVDVARELKHFVQMTSIDSPSKVVVIDEADRLSIAAQNALLKTLEEPPGRAILVLVCESPGALLPTVRSRCQRIYFAPLQQDELLAVLGQHGIDGKAAEDLALTSLGSPGRALELRRLVEEGDIERLESSIAALKADRYVPTVEFANALGQSEKEMTARMGLLGEILQQKISRSIARGEIDAETADRRLRRLTVLNDSVRLLRRYNPNRPLLAEATAIKLAKLG